MRRCIVVGISLAMLVPAAAAAKVRLVSVTSPVSAGAYASLTVEVSPVRTCSITVRYKSGPSQAQGLGPRSAANGRITWRWKVGTRTTPGRWPIVVSCGSAGELRTTFTVKGGSGIKSSSGSSRCDPNYSSGCVPRYPPDLNCDDIRALGIAPVRVVGSDPHRLDGDGDGWGCE